MPNDDPRQKPKVSASLSVGKEIDAALGDVIRGLLLKPSTEVGNLIAESIGILGDRVKRKREANVRIGMDSTWELLESKDVQLKDVTPPSEEDLYVIIDGMSVAEDDQIRKLWSGLLAAAIDPGNANSIERPITSAITSLSPADARIIRYAAFVTENERSIRNDAMKTAGVANVSGMTFGDARRVEEERQAMRLRLSAYMEATSMMEADFGLGDLSARADWDDNLVRLGIIQPKPEEYSPQLDFVHFSVLRREA